MSDIRKDPLSDTWVIIAPERASRPHTEEKKEEEELKSCPFCESDEVKSQILPYAICAAEFDKDGNWLTRIVKNKYPALKPEEKSEKKDIDDIFHIESGVGGHEILIETPVHTQYGWAEMPIEQIQAVLRNYRCRYSYWRKDPRIAYLAIFRNHGKVAGASIRHPHSQMIATPWVPPRIQQQLSQMENYFNYNNSCLMCTIINNEKKNKDRLVLENDHFIAITSFAPRFPYETLIVPKKHESAFENISDEHIKSLASIASELFKKINKLLNDPPHNLILHVSPIKEPDLKYYHWHMEIIIKLSQPAGFEWGTGVYINSVSPELAAKELRDV